MGDLGDFGKFGLLRALCFNGDTDDSVPVSLGVVWYLVPDERNSGDGRFIEYLTPSVKHQQVFRACDPELYDALGRIVTWGAREVASIQDGDILPRDSCYYDVSLTFEGLHGVAVRGRSQRLKVRERWLAGALRSTADCDVVFLDPDNGLEVATRADQPRGPKYAFFSELLPFVQREQSLVVYHHIGRRGSAKDQINDRMAQIEDELACRPFALLYHRGSARVFFVLPAERHRDVLSSRAEGLLQTPWARHFELITPD
ncbi:MAG: hypothetical protein F4X54_05245 [Chloroflexi bacterium]|nr:hypothetical protein [Chloroflexota bacterium]